MYKFFCLIAVLCSFQFNCDSEREGVVQVVTYLPVSDSIPLNESNVEIKFKIIFKGEKSIQEVPRINFNNGHTSIDIKHYSYLDTKNNICINYENFSDTANIIDIYFNVDSVQIAGGWNFFSDIKPAYNSITDLRDTLINDQKLRTVKLTKTVGGEEYKFLLFLDCSQNRNRISIFKSIGDSLGCAITRNDVFKGGKVIMRKELVLTSSKLSNKERCVFKAWTENAEYILGKENYILYRNKSHRIEILGNSIVYLYRKAVVCNGLAKSYCKLPCK